MCYGSCVLCRISMNIIVSLHYIMLDNEGHVPFVRKFRLLS